MIARRRPLHRGGGARGVQARIYYLSPSRVVAVENTHNMGGGIAVAPDAARPTVMTAAHALGHVHAPRRRAAVERGDRLGRPASARWPPASTR
jgi:hypothetical protein